MTNCDSVRQLVDAYLDDELASTSKTWVEAHLGECRECLSFMESRRSLKWAIRRAVAYVPAPTGLGLKYGKVPKTSVRRFTLISIGLAFAVCAMSTVLLWPSRVTDSERLTSDLIASYRRSLSPDRLVEFKSSNLANIKPWFKDKGIRYCLSVPTFKPGGFQFLGGRIASSRGRPIATLVCAQGKHIIDVFITPSYVAGRANLDLEGIHVRGREDCGLVYWAVSDANPSILVDIQSEFPSRDR